ncbi:hypothetical protein BKI52_36660 [marine bacterium AO1-C]|nr:hypothetical protein BKI52_36660 [marine bacterium AO1-C]
MIKEKVITFIIALSLCLNSLFTLAQISHAPLVKQYQKKYPKTKAAVLNSEVVYSIQFNEKTQLPQIIEQSEEHYLALKPGKVSRYAFYDQYSAIKQSKRRGQNASISKKLEVMCGNYSSNGIFYSDAQVCQYPFRFILEGETQKLNLTKHYNDPRYFTRVFFTDQLPVVKKTITFKVPQWATLELKTYNFAGFDIQQKKVTQEDGSTHYIFTALNLPPIEHFDDVPGQTHTYPHLLVLFKRFEQKNQTTQLLGSVNDLYQWYRKVADQVDNQHPQLKPIVNDLLRGLDTPKQKAEAIFYWVQDNIRYIAFEDGVAAFKPEDAQKVYTKKYGDCKGMANLMKSMLKIAGFDARLTWIGTNHLAYDYSTPSIAVANHMICTLLLNNKKYYLDATEKYIPFGEYAERIQGRPILIENGAKYWLEQIPIAKQAANQVLRTHQLMVQSESLVGWGKHAYQGEQKKEVLYYLNFTSQKKTRELVQLLVDLDDKNCHLDSLQFSDPNQRAGKFTIDYQIKLNNRVASFDSEMYIDIDFYKEFKQAKVEKDRLNALNLREKVFRKSVVQLQIPEGYQVKHLPKNLDIKHPAFSIQANFAKKNKLITYTKTITTAQSMIQKADFAAWNAAIEALSKMYEDQIILVKGK